MKRYVVVISSSARDDLARIRQNIISEFDDSYSADKVVADILKKAKTLQTFPRISVVHHQIDDKSLRYVHTKKYTIVYYIDERDSKVFVYAIINSRRNIQTFLEKRD